MILPKAMLIDMDDTILAAGERPAVLLQIAHELAGDLAPHSPQAVADRLDAELERFWSDPARHRAARFGVNEARLQVMVETFRDLGPPGLGAEIAGRFAARFAAVRDEITTFFPGALEGLKGLKARGVKLTLITNGGADTQRAKIERFGLARWFDHIQIEGEAGFGKPDEQAYHHAMAMLGTRPNETWVVGDNLEWEVATPQRLGLTGVWVDGYGRGLPVDSPVRPDRIIRSLTELLPE